MVHAVARLCSLIFHPLMTLTYMLLLLLWINPYLFGINHISDPIAKTLVLRVFLSSFFIPGVAVLMLRFTGLLKSLEMPDKQDRIAPFVITGMFYIWLFRNFLDNTQIPALFTSFTLGATIALFLAFLVNIFSKISLHTLSMGGLLGVLVLLLSIYPQLDIPTFWFMQTRFLLVAALILAGCIGSFRLILGAHEPIDLWGGYLVGFVAQFIAARFIL